MPPPEHSDAQRLAQGASSLGVVLTADQSRALLDYLALLTKWNRVYNLSAVRDPTAMLVQHVLDSLAVVGPLRRHALGGSARVLDVGSGGGLPGVVLAIAMPELDVTCVDAVGKKTAFVREVAGLLSLKNLHAVHARVESLSGRFDVIASRAFASLADFVALTTPLGDTSSAWMAMKGKVPDAEIADLPAGFDVFHVEQLVVPGLGADRCLVWMRKTAS